MNPDQSQANSAELNTIAATIEQMLFSVDWPQGRFHYISPAYQSIWEMPIPTALSTEEWLQTFHPEDKKLVGDFFSNLGPERSELECRIITGKEATKFVLIRAITAKKEAGETSMSFGSVEDVTTQQEYRATIQHFADRKNTFLQLLSHDLLGPLGNIQLSAKLLADGGLEDEDNTASMLKIISQNCMRSVNLIQNLVSDEFLTTSRTNLIKQRIELVSKLYLIIHEFAESPNVTTQKFEFICDAEKIYVNVDEAKFTQVIINLLSNALKFTPEYGIIRLSLEEKEGYIHITLSDTGIGIPADLQPFIFDKFTRARRPGLRGEPTIGLGLSIIKTVVEWHQGTIRLESKEGEGTTISIRLPVS